MDISIQRLLANIKLFECLLQVPDSPMNEFGAFAGCTGGEIVFLEEATLQSTRTRVKQHPSTCKQTSDTEGPVFNTSKLKQS